MIAPWLSVIMPIRNGREYLPYALDSIAAQGADDVEVLAIDDGSTDGSSTVLERYVKRANLRIVQRSGAGNWAAATNLGLQLARGEFICTLHQDDCWAPGRLAAIRSRLARLPDIGLLLHPCWYIDRHGKRLGVWRCPLPGGGRPVSSDLVMRRLLVQNFIGIPAPVFRRRTAISVGGLDESLRYTADWDLWLKLAKCGPVLYHTSPLACFRIHANAQTLTFPAKTFRLQLETTLDRHLNAWPHADADTVHAARFSIEVNSALAAWSHGGGLPSARLAWDAMALGPNGWWRYLRDSRIVERAGCRLRALGLTIRRSTSARVPRP